MPKKIEKIYSLQEALKKIGKKYDLLIIDAINQLNGRARFNQILTAIPTINPRILSMRLKDMERNRLLTKHLILGTPIKTEYELTEKSKELIEIIDRLKQWYQKNC
ncbi:MAG: helix-turn-helix transcriptional regulator [Candidatus Diapherotrites archaeon]|nr:helix-turn-helix transcriptional regulator [Candidatus Diapherotrites archaeon]